MSKSQGKQTLEKKAEMIYTALKKGSIKVDCGNNFVFSLAYELVADITKIKIKELFWNNNQPKFEAIIPLEGIIVKPEAKDYDLVIEVSNMKNVDLYTKIAKQIVTKFHYFNVNLTFPNISKNPLKIIK